MKVGLFPMVADVMHAGHILAMKEARANCDYLIVALYCCPKRKPNIVQSIFERYTQLDAIKYVDEVIPYEDEDDAHRIILSLDFDVYFLGADYKNKPFEGKELVKNLGKEIHYLSRNHTMSSTQLKTNIANSANRDYSTEPKVIAVDFDGCICKLAWPNIGEPNWDIINALKEEKANGTKLILWSCRCGDLLDDAIKACAEWGITFDAVNENIPERLLKYGFADSRKISADEYWDDLALTKGNN
jgi:cytidyltransferase-like protein